MKEWKKNHLYLLKSKSDVIVIKWKWYFISLKEKGEMNQRIERTHAFRLNDDDDLVYVSV